MIDRDDRIKAACKVSGAPYRNDISDEREKICAGCAAFIRMQLIS